MTTPSEDKLPKIGYLYHYPDIHHPTDRFRLDVYISDIPTKKHFDVIRGKYPVFMQQNGAVSISVHHPWTDEKSYRVCPGLVVMEDRNGKKKEAFTLGGQLTIEVKEFQTICQLTSAAPIFGLNAASPVEKILVDELEIVFAEYRAEIQKPGKFENLLCQTEPFPLYLTCLQALIDRVEKVPHKDELTFDYMMYLHTQWHRLEAVGKLPLVLPTLEELFKQAG